MLLTNSNGEYGDGSSNKTPHIVGHRPQTAFSCTHTAAITRKLRVRGKEAGEPREHVYCTAGRGEIQGPAAPLFPVAPLLSLQRRGLPRLRQWHCTQRALELKFFARAETGQAPSLQEFDFCRCCFYFAGT